MACEAVDALHIEGTAQGRVQIVENDPWVTESLLAKAHADLRTCLQVLGPRGLGRGGFFNGKGNNAEMHDWRRMRTPMLSASFLFDCRRPPPFFRCSQEERCSMEAAYSQLRELELERAALNARLSRGCFDHYRAASVAVHDRAVDLSGASPALRSPLLLRLISPLLMAGGCFSFTERASGPGNLGTGSAEPEEMQSALQGRIFGPISIPSPADERGSRVVRSIGCSFFSWAILLLRMEESSEA